MQSRRTITITTFLAFSLLFTATSQATVILDTGITALTSSNPVQLGILNRNNVISDWSTPKTFPGAINLTTSYRYATYAVPAVAFPFVQITVDDIARSALTFVSAYSNLYQPTPVLPANGLNVNYLGDAGNAGNLFAGTDPRAFQVVAPLTSNLVVVVNDISSTGADLGRSYHIIVEGFYDSNFNDTVPEPATFALSAAGLAGASVIVYLRRKPRSSAITDLG